MNCVVYFGKLDEKRKHRGSKQNENPYKILEQPVQLERKGHEVLHHGHGYFKNKEQVDW